MLNNIAIQKLLFIDIETASETANFSALKEPKRKLWGKKHRNISFEIIATPSDTYTERAAIYAEFGKVVCISCAFFEGEELHIYSFYHAMERDLHLAFSKFLEKKALILCGHNIKEFDIPYLCRRMLINKVTLPKKLNITGKKPWEVNFVDTLQLWKFGDYKSYTSLDLLAYLFDIPSSKDDIDGSQVGKVYWQEKDLARIVKYCQKDVVTVVRLIQRWQQKSLIEDEKIIVKFSV